MNKNQFIGELKSYLKTLSEGDKQEILFDYEEHFSIGKEEGRSEEDISQALGSPRQISKEILATYHLEKVKTKANTGNIIRAVWAVIGLGFFNLVIVIGPFVAVTGVVFGLWIVSLSFILSPLLVLFGLIVNPNAFQIFNLFAAIALAGLGIFLGLGMLKVTKVLVRGLIKYLNYNVSLVKGGLKV